MCAGGEMSDRSPLPQPSVAQCSVPRRGVIVVFIHFSEQLTSARLNSVLPFGAYKSIISRLLTLFTCLLTDSD